MAYFGEKVLGNDDKSSRKYAPRQGATPRRLKIAIGDKFGSWEVIGSGEPRPGSLHVYWRCRCVCGTVRDHKATVLNKGRARSCGCQTSRYLRSTYSPHGMTGTPEYTSWSSMLGRCLTQTDEHYPNYGGRGITVCERWRCFANFFEDMGPRPSPKHTLGRQNNDGNYEPGNVKWETPLEQSRNRRTSRYLSLNGETMTLEEWAKRIGIGSSAISLRIRKGMSVEEALTKPRSDSRSPNWRKGAR